MQFVLKAGDSQFNATRPHRGSYSGSLSVVLVEPGRVVLVEPGRFGRAPPYLTASWASSRRARWSKCMAWLSPRLVLRSWLMFYVGTFSPQPTTSSCQRANSIVPGIGPVARIVHKDHHSFNYAGEPAHPTAARPGPGRLIFPWLKPGALRRNLVKPTWRTRSVTQSMTHMGFLPQVTRSAPHGPGFRRWNSSFLDRRQTGQVAGRAESG